jgi:hypothetical protein
MSQVMAAFRERFNGHVTTAYVSDSNQFMVAYWSVYGDFSATLYVLKILMSKRCQQSMPESEDTSKAENLSFPASTLRNSETRRKRKSGKSQALSELLALEGRKIEQLEKAV